MNHICLAYEAATAILTQWTRNSFPLKGSLFRYQISQWRESYRNFTESIHAADVACNGNLFLLAATARANTHQPEITLPHGGFAASALEASAKHANQVMAMLRLTEDIDDENEPQLAEIRQLTLDSNFCDRLTAMITLERGIATNGIVTSDSNQPKPPAKKRGATKKDNAEVVRFIGIPKPHGETWESLRQRWNRDHKNRQFGDKSSIRKAYEDGMETE